MARALTKKARGFVEEYAKTGNGTQAALANYNTTDENTAAVIASENLRKPKILEALEEALPDKTLYQIHREGLFATKPFFDKEGNKIAEDADYNTRHKYLHEAYLIKQRLNGFPEGGQTVNVQIVNYGNSNPTPLQAEELPN